MFVYSNVNFLFFSFTGLCERGGWSLTLLQTLTLFEKFNHFAKVNPFAKCNSLAISFFGKIKIKLTLKKIVSIIVPTKILLRKEDNI